jgi:predicted PhzF superfamily epimerase YddE/YHI9
MSAPIVQVDAFTDHAFGGNPAGVCILQEPKSAEWMQSVALEMNLSETAFLQKLPDGSFDLRWFTPAVEVDLCGHATLASAHSLWESGQLASGEEARFHTRSGLLTAKRAGEWIELDFPVKHAIESAPPPGLIEALGAAPKHVAKNQFDYLVEVSETELLKMSPNHGLLRTIPVRGVIVTSGSSDPTFDFVSRFFAPGSGIDEDPVTGSAHTALTPFWAARLGKTTMMARQASARGGILRVTMNGDRVLLGGRAVTTLRGELMV